MIACRAWASLGVLSALMLMLAGCGRTGDEVMIGSKRFTESVVLGEVLKELVADSGTPVRHRRALGGTRLRPAGEERSGIHSRQHANFAAGRQLRSVRRRILAAEPKEP